MNEQKYGTYILNQIRDLPANEPVTTASVAAELADTFHIDMGNAKKITNVNLKRLTDKSLISNMPSFRWDFRYTSKFAKGKRRWSRLAPGSPKTRFWFLP